MQQKLHNMTNHRYIYMTVSILPSSLDTCSDKRLLSPFVWIDSPCY